MVILPADLQNFSLNFQASVLIAHIVHPKRRQSFSEMLSQNTGARPPHEKTWPLPENLCTTRGGLLTSAISLQMQNPKLQRKVSRSEWAMSRGISNRPAP